MLSGRIFSIPLLFFLLVLIHSGCSSCNDQSSKESDLSVRADGTSSVKVDDSISVSTGNKGGPASAPGERDNPQLEGFRQVKNLLVFHTKDTMKLDSTYTATLALGKDISLDELTEKIKKIAEPGGKIKVTDTTLEIGFRMSATLEDKASSKDPNFSISPVGSASDIRVFDAKKNKMVWQWNVTPLKEGQHQLSLSISMIDKSGIASNPETQWYYIVIYSAPKKKTSSEGFGVFFSKNWQWLISAILVPLFVAWFTTRQRRRNEQILAAERASEKEHKKKRK